MPARFDLVWCHFPEHKFSDAPSPKPRPGLVFAAEIGADGKPYVFVHYGTSRGFDKLNVFQFVIANLRDLDHCKLDFQTRFDLYESVTLPWSEEYFATKPGSDVLVFASLPTRQREALVRRARTLQQLRALSRTHPETSSDPAVIALRDTVKAEQRAELDAPNTGRRKKTGGR